MIYPLRNKKRRRTARLVEFAIHLMAEADGLYLSATHDEIAKQAGLHISTVKSYMNLMEGRDLRSFAPGNGSQRWLRVLMDHPDAKDAVESLLKSGRATWVDDENGNRHLLSLLELEARREHAMEDWEESKKPRRS